MLVQIHFAVIVLDVFNCSGKSIIVINNPEIESGLP